MKHEFKTRGHSWRVQSDDRGRFDEIVVVIGKKPRPKDRRNGLILHAKMLDDRCCFINVAGLCLWVRVGKDGIARIMSQVDRRAR